jgi:23S rRNA (guanosine2251-2'-O)-methyltransferase
MKKESFIYGLRPVIEAIKSGKEFEKILIQQGLRGEIFRELFQLARELEIPYQFVPAEKLGRLTHQNHQGIIAYISEITYQKLEDIIPMVYETGKTPLFLILDRITDVRNLGAIARTAECAGVDAVIVPSRGSALINSDAIKTSAGALYKVPLIRSHNLKETLQFLQHSGIAIAAASEKGSTIWHQSDLRGPLALIMGSEGEGVSPEYLKMASIHLTIPLLGEIDSLNVSVASGIILFEVVRQRGIQ